MAIVRYRCNTCKREIQLKRNTEGLDHFGRCIITHGCRGSLYQLELLPDYIRGSTPKPVSGLDDWVGRKVVFDFIQPIKKKKWIINHNMGAVPSVFIYVDWPSEDDPNGRRQITPTDTNIINDNTIELVFDRSYSGVAQLVARQTDPDLFNSDTRVQETTSDQQITTNSELTIATAVDTYNSSDNITLLVEFVSSTGASHTIPYLIDTAPSINSPWVDYNEGIVFNGKIYNVRSVNIITSELDANLITTGSEFKIVGVDNPAGSPVIADSIDSKNILVLLAVPPYETPDKIVDKYIDATDLTTTSGYLNGAELFAPSNIVIPVYPHIRSLR